MNKTYCALCDMPLSGHCVYFSELATYGECWICESCLRKAVIKALKEWDEEADRMAKEDEEN